MRVSVLGLGAMGSALAVRLVAAGHAVAAYNRSDGPFTRLGDIGVVRLRRPSDAWGHGPMVVSMLADAAAIDAVTSGPHGLFTEVVPERATLVEMSTISASASASIACRASLSGVRYLRAPVSGNPSVLTAGALTIIVSGDPDVIDATMALLGEIAPTVLRVGDGEEARVIKLALNLVLGGTAQLIAEAVALGEAHGVGRGLLLEVMGESAVGSPFVRYKTPGLVEDDYTSTFSVRLLAKDLGLAIEAASAAGLPLPVTELVDGLARDCVARGGGEHDMMVLLPRLREAAQLATGTREPFDTTSQSV